MLFTRGAPSLIESLEYYFSASFHYEGENYWGIDRLGYLEERLVELGLKKNNSHKNIVKKLEKSKFDSNQIIKKDNSLDENTARLSDNLDVIRVNDATVIGQWSNAVTGITISLNAATTTSDLDNIIN